MTIAPGWHVYANPPRNEDYEAVQCELAFTGANAPKVLKIDYPPDKPMENGKFLGYEGQVSIRAAVHYLTNTLSIEPSELISTAVCMSPLTP